MTSIRKIASFAALSLSLVVASGVAYAQEKGHGGPTFPVAGAEFKQHVEARLEKRRAGLEKRITEGNVPADKAAEMRARFAADAEKVKAEVEKAVADGTVTKDEAKAVRAASGHGGGGCKHGKDAPKGA